jgi:altronate hydrolase
MIIIDPRDNVATAIKDLGTGEQIYAKHGTIRLLRDIPFGHKIALQAIAKGEYVIKYGVPIGRATVTIDRGDHVHVHNVADITDEVRKGV